jgi:hypothetical protein
MCVEIVSLGNVALSTNNTRYPLRASSMAVGEPAHRAPTMIASYIRDLPRSCPTPRRARYKVRCQPGLRFGESTHALPQRVWVIAATMRSEELVLVGECDRGGTRWHVELGEDVTHVSIDRALAHR